MAVARVHNRWRAILFGSERKRLAAKYHADRHFFSCS
jgi:hypothetical protein